MWRSCSWTLPLLLRNARSFDRVLQWNHLDSAAMRFPSNELGVSSMDELLAWTTSYLHFKEALEVIGQSPELVSQYVSAFDTFADRFAQDLCKQQILESKLPKAMREDIAARKPHLAVIREVLASRN